MYKKQAVEQKKCQDIKKYLRTIHRPAFSIFVLKRSPEDDIGSSNFQDTIYLFSSPANIP